MKGFFLRLFTGSAVKNGIAIGAQVAAMIVDALNGILAGDGLTDARRKQLHTIMIAAASVRDFLRRLSELVGAPSQVNISTASLIDHAGKLDRITDAL